MASNPPFQLEDQTDEDFFDKLVDDEFESTEPRSNFAEVSDSDEVKALANLNIDDLGVEGEGEGDGGVRAIQPAVNFDVHMPSKDGGAEEMTSLVSSGSFAFSSVIQSNSSVMGSEVVPESTMCNSSGAGGSGVKEVQWSLFNPESENGNNGFESYSDFFNDLGESGGNLKEELNSEVKTDSLGGEFTAEDLGSSVNYGQYQEAQGYVDGHDLSSSQDWDSLYPGWRYDHNSGQWYQVDGYDMTAVNQGIFDNNSSVGQVVSDGNSEVSYLQQTVQSAVETVSESGTTASVSSFIQGSQLNNGYPDHMVFDPLYPGWYYDTISLEWRSLDTYVASDQTQVQNNEHHNKNQFAVTSTSQYNDTGVQNGLGKSDNYGSQDYDNQGQDHSQGGSFGNYNQQKQSQTDNYGSMVSIAQGQDNWSESNNYNQQTPSQVDNFGSLGYGSQGQDSSWSGSYYNAIQPNQNGFASAGTDSHSGDSTYHQNGKTDNYNSQGFGGQAQESNWGGSFNNNIRGESNSSFSGNQQEVKNAYGSKNSMNSHIYQLNSFNSNGAFEGSDKTNQKHADIGSIGLQSFIPHGNFSQEVTQTKLQQNEQMNDPNDHYSSQKIPDFSEQPFQSHHPSHYSPNMGMGRSSAGSPPHALATFGFGGKLIVMKDNNSLSNSSYGNQEQKGSVSILNLMEVVTDKADTLSIGMGSSDYFRSLCQHSFPGPLVGGNVGSKELNKWIDERISHCEGPHMDQRKGDTQRLLLSLLKIACQYYGKLRSPLGADTLRESNCPESAVAKLFSSTKGNRAQVSQYGAPAHCLLNFPSESQILVTASDVQNLLVSGRRKEALYCAQQGQLWGLALVLASQLGDQFYVDTVKQMALRQLIPGSPLRTLCLLIAGQPADVFSTDTPTDNSLLDTVQFGANGMLDEWEENLAVITANRTKDDELVLFHLGDCLWKERSQITAAHICYLVAEANFESYSDSARLCLIGADHWKFPRAYASPEAIQRTELYEYSKVLGNSQFTLLPFQPYKLLYAHMLAEVGKVSESLKYCQAVLKSLKTSRAPEVEMWKQLALSLEERVRTHQQGGYASNLAPAKLVGKLLNFFDSTTQRVVGGLPPPVPSTSHGSAQGNEHYYQQAGPRVSSSQSTMAMSSLMPSASTEPINDGATDNNRMKLHNRSVSEPNFGQVDLSKKDASTNAQGKSLAGRSRFVRFSFGSELLQKTVGLVLKSRGDRQAKLGETNKFYYDDNLKRWVEEGTAPLAEEVALPPPPTAAAYQNGMSNYSLKNAPNSEGISTSGISDSKSPPHSESSSGMPPIPPGSSHFSAPGRMGVRSRYVDTFNKGGGSPANTFQSPSIQSSIKSNAPGNAKFFVPAPVSSTDDATQESMQEALTRTNEDPSTSSINSFQSPPPSLSSSTIMQRFPSTNKFSSSNGSMGNGYGSAAAGHSRRTASWGGGSFNEAFSPPKTTEIKPLGEDLGTSTFPDDLHEVEL